MPFQSARQARWGNSPTGKKALGGQAAVEEWNQATDFSDLPETARTKRRGKLKKALRKKDDAD